MIRKKNDFLSWSPANHQPAAQKPIPPPFFCPSHALFYFDSKKVVFSHPIKFLQQQQQTRTMASGMIKMATVTRNEDSEQNNTNYEESDIGNVGDYIDVSADTRKYVRRWKEGGRAVITKKHNNGMVDVQYVLTGQKEVAVHPDRIAPIMMDNIARVRDVYDDHVGPSLLSFNRRAICATERTERRKKKIAQKKENAGKRMASDQNILLSVLRKCKEPSSIRENNSLLRYLLDGRANNKKKGWVLEDIKEITDRHLFGKTHTILPKEKNSCGLLCCPHVAASIQR